MGRAPNPGAPQRVSAHVVPKAPALPAPAVPAAFAGVPASPGDEEEEKTTIESGGWEEEASTTVEQGEVAEKLRALGIEQARRPNTSITATNGEGVSEEHTVDDQRGAAALAMVPPPKIARLVITQGNDVGQTIEIRPGKVYTIGRGLDNDLVLTDMTVSRKHFDLRHDDGTWVLADRGSGNGTLINNHLEDAPFVLATGDVIEIGNTSFRFDQPNGVPRTPPSLRGSDEDLELSTISGHPVAGPDAATPDRLVTPVGRPKTLPPPAPVARPRPSPSRPSGFALERPSQPARPPSIPPIAMSSAMAPVLVAAPGLPTLQPPTAAPPPPPQSTNRAAMQPALLEAPPKSLPGTLPGQAPPVQQVLATHAAPPSRLPFTFPGGSSPPRGPSAEMPRQRISAILPGVTVATAGPAGRDVSSTSLVQPISYSNGQPAIVPPRAYGPPPALTPRVKMALAAAAVALFAAIATIAIVRGTSGDPGPTAVDHAATDSSAAKPTGIVEPPAGTRAPSPPPPSTPHVITPPPRPERIAPIVTPIIPPASSPPSGSGSAGSAVPSIRPSAATPPPGPANPPGAAPSVRPNPAAALGPAAAPQPTSSVVQPAPQIAPSSAVASPPAAASPAAPPSAGDKKPIAAPVSVPDRKPVRRPDRNDRNDKKPDKRAVKSDDRDKIEIESPSKKHGGRALQDIKNDASALYRKKDFSGAATTASTGAAAMTGVDAQELKAMASIYLQLGKSYNVGMASGTKATDAFQALSRAVDFDREVGGAYVAEMQEKLVAIATRAAMSYMAVKEYESALRAVQKSEQLGSTSPSNKTVRDKLNEVAADLYRAAQAEIAKDPDSAKEKLRQIQKIVEPKNPLYARASKLLNGP